MDIDQAALEMQAAGLIEEVRFSIEELDLPDAIEVVGLVIEGLRSDLTAMQDDLESR